VTRMTLSELSDSHRLTAQLAAAGLGRDAARGKAARLAGVVATLEQMGAARSAVVSACYVPGRIEVLGKHTDYAGGRSLIAAAERGFCAVALPGHDQTITMVDANAGLQCQFPLSPSLSGTAGDWSNYPITVARRVARNFPGELQGATIAFASDLPVAAGMSSSSALMVATFLLLADINRLATRDEYAHSIQSETDLAGYLGTIENGHNFGQLKGDRGVGTFGGSEDHTAMICSQPGLLGQFAYCPVRFERSVPLPNGTLLAIASSGIAAEKTGAAMDQYNRAAHLADEAARIWRAASGRNDSHLAAAVTSSPDAPLRLRECFRRPREGPTTPQQLLDRFEQFLAEDQQILPQAVDSLARSDLGQFGSLVDRSQQLATELLGNQVPETIGLQRMARDLGAVAASAFGAGFGGSVWALVGEDQVDTFLAAWSTQYERAFPDAACKASFFTSGAGPAAFLIASV
jgi:galactokinase